MISWGVVVIGFGWWVFMIVMTGKVISGDDDQPARPHEEHPELRYAARTALSRGAWN